MKKLILILALSGASAAQADYEFVVGGVHYLARRAGAVVEVVTAEMPVALLREPIGENPDCDAFAGRLVRLRPIFTACEQSGDGGSATCAFARKQLDIVRYDAAPDAMSDAEATQRYHAGNYVRPSGPQVATVLEAAARSEQVSLLRVRLATDVVLADGTPVRVKGLNAAAGSLTDGLRRMPGFVARAVEYDSARHVFRVAGREQICDLAAGRARIDFVMPSVARLDLSGDALIDSLWRLREAIRPAMESPAKTDLARAMRAGYAAAQELAGGFLGEPVTEDRLEELFGLLIAPDEFRLFPFEGIDGFRAALFPQKTAMWLQTWSAGMR